MDYFRHYDNLIFRAKERLSLDGRGERHHVVPRCMGGDSRQTNIVVLTPEEHYVAHKLLTKMYPDQRSLAIAAILMSSRCSGNKANGWLRKRAAEGMIGKRFFLGKTHGPIARAKLSAARKGKPLSEEHIKKMADAKRGTKWSLESRQRRSIAFKGRRLSLETRAKISASHMGKKKSPEHVAKMRANALGKILSPETKMRISIAMRAYRASQRINEAPQ